MKNENEILKSSQDEWERIMTKWKMLQPIDNLNQQWRVKMLAEENSC